MELHCKSQQLCFERGGYFTKTWNHTISLFLILVYIEWCPFGAARNNVFPVSVVLFKQGKEKPKRQEKEELDPEKLQEGGPNWWEELQLSAVFLDFRIYRFYIYTVIYI